MDDDSRTILLLKIGVGALVVIALIVIAAIIISLSGRNKGSSGGDATTRRTLEGSTEITEVSKKTNSSSTSTTSISSSTTSTTSTQVVTQAPVTQAPYVPPVTQAPYVPPVTQAPYVPPVTQPAPSYTELRDQTGTSYSFASNLYEWDLVHYINRFSGRTFKVASELRNAAERLADACCSTTSAGCESAVSALAQELGYNLQVTAYRSVSTNEQPSIPAGKEYYQFTENAYSDLRKKYNYGNSSYNWIGVGVIQKFMSNRICYTTVLSF